MNLFLVHSLAAACACLVLIKPAYGADAYMGRFSLGYRLGANLGASFGDSVGFPTTASIGPSTGGGIDRTYDDGFNRVDITGNAGGKTWNWGYTDPANAPAGGNVIRMSSTSIAPLAERRADDDLQHGLELGYTRMLGQVGAIRWGFELAAGWLNFSVSDRQSLSSTGNRTVDEFSTGGIIPPLAPYIGSFAGPGPLIGDSPTRTSSAFQATINGWRNLDAQIGSLRLGPSLELPLAQSFWVSVSGGLALSYVDAEFSFQESSTLAGGTTLSRQGRASEQDVLVGGYVAAGLNWQFARQWVLFASAQFVDSGNLTLAAAGRTATLRLGRGVFLTTGFGFSF